MVITVMLVIVFSYDSVMSGLHCMLLLIVLFH